MVYRLLLVMLGGILFLALVLFFLRRLALVKIFYPYFLFGVFCFIFTIALLIYHHLPYQYPDVVFNFTVYGHFKAVINYDSPEFMKDSLYPYELFEETNIRQSRPGLILLVAGLNKLVSPLKGWIMPLFRATGTEIPKEYYIPYALYGLMNYLFLFLSFFIYLKILAIGTKPVFFGAIFLGGLFVFNDVVKAFLLTPHTQIFNLLAPLVCLYVFEEVKNHNLFESGRLFILSFLVGLGVTAYATFALFIPLVVIAQGWIILRDKRKVDWRMVLRLALVILLTMLPLLAWIAYVYTRTGSFYQFEIVRYQQFVWILSLLRAAPAKVIPQVIGNLSRLAWSAAMQAVILPAVILGVCVTGLDRNHRLLQQLAWRKQFPVSALIVSGLFLLFFALAGLTANRVAFSAVPPLVVGTAVVVNDILGNAGRLRRGLGNASVILLVCLNCLIVLSKVGPFS